MQKDDWLPKEFKNMTQQDFEDLLDTIKQTNIDNENLKLQIMDLNKSTEDLMEQLKEKDNQQLEERARKDSSAEFNVDTI